MTRRRTAFYSNLGFCRVFESSRDLASLAITKEKLQFLRSLVDRKPVKNIFTYFFGMFISPKSDEIDDLRKDFCF